MGQVQTFLRELNNKLRQLKEEIVWCTFKKELLKEEVESALKAYRQLIELEEKVAQLERKDNASQEENRKLTAKVLEQAEELKEWRTWKGKWEQEKVALLNVNAEGDVIARLMGKLEESREEVSNLREDLAMTNEKVRYLEEQRLKISVLAAEDTEEGFQEFLKKKEEFRRLLLEGHDVGEGEEGEGRAEEAIEIMKAEGTNMEMEDPSSTLEIRSNKPVLDSQQEDIDITFPDPPQDILESTVSYEATPTSAKVLKTEPGINEEEADRKEGEEDDNLASETDNSQLAATTSPRRVISARKRKRSRTAAMIPPQFPGPPRGFLATLEYFGNKKIASDIKRKE